MTLTEFLEKHLWPFVVNHFALILPALTLFLALAFAERVAELVVGRNRVEKALSIASGVFARYLLSFAVIVLVAFAVLAVVNNH